MKTPLPNIFNCTAFKNIILFYLTKIKINLNFQTFSSSCLRPSIEKRIFYNIRSTYICIQLILLMMILKKITGNKDMNPSLLDSKELRGEVKGAYYKIMKKIADISNQNLVRNSVAHISNGGKVFVD